jgi:hypothetical protein
MSMRHERVQRVFQLGTITTLFEDLHSIEVIHCGLLSGKHGQLDAILGNFPGIRPQIFGQRLTRVFHFRRAGKCVAAMS